MTEQELKFILSAQDEGLRRGIEAAEKAVEGLDKAVLQLAGSQVKYNTAAARFVDGSGKFVSNQKALQQAGIITSNQLQEQIRLYDELIVKFKQDALVTSQLIRQKQALQRQYGLLERAQTREAGGLRTNTQLYFQAGQAISDFAVAGVRGAANNIEFLAASLGASAPLLIGISLASAALFTFGDDIAKALTPIRTQAKDTKEALSDMLKVIENERPDLTLLEEQLPAAIEENRKKIKQIEDEVRNSTFFSAFLNQNSRVWGAAIRAGWLDGLLGSDEAVERLGRLTGETQAFEERLKEINERNETANSLSENSLVRNNALKAETIRLDLELAGLAEEAAGYTNTQLLEMEKKVGLAGIIKELTKDNVSDEEKLRKALEDVKSEINSIITGRKSELDILKEQLRLEEQRRDRLKKIAEEQEKFRKAQAIIDAATGTRPINPVASPPLSNRELAKLLRRDNSPIIDSSFLSGEDAAGRLAEQFKEEQAAILDAQQAVISGTDRTAEAFRKAGFDATTFYTTTRQGQIALQETIATSVGAISGSFADLFQSMANSGKKGSEGLFVAYKAFATAQAIINTYQAASKALAEGGPILGPILAAAAIIQGGFLVAKIASTKPGDTSVSGGGGSRGPSVTALGFGSQRSQTESRTIGSRPVGSLSSRPGVNVVVSSEERITPSGDIIRGIRAALVTEAKKGGPGKF